MKRNILTCLLSVFILASCNQATTPDHVSQNNAPGHTGEQAALARVFAAQQAELGLNNTDDLVVIDGLTGETYSSQRGFGKVELPRVSPDGKVFLSDGAVLPLSADQSAVGLSAQAGVGCESTTYCPYTRVETSSTGYRKINATIVLPSSVNGVDADGEAAYHYTGFRSSTGNAEAGSYLYANFPTTWRAYARYTDTAGNHRFLTSLTLDDGTSSNIAMGTSLNIQSYVSADNQLTFQYTFGGATRTRTIINVRGITASGSGQFVRRVGSLLLNSPGSTTGKWRSLTFSTPTSTALATSANSTATKTAGAGTNNSTWVNPYYDEDLNLITP